MGTGLTEVDGLSIAWEREGSGEPVVLVHGITECRSSWAPLAKLLAADHDVIAVDLRGHGESDMGASYEFDDLAGDVRQVIDALGLGRPHLVGHSLGGAVVSALGALGAARSVTSIDQSLQLSAFKEQIVAVEAMLRDPDTFGLVISALFEQLAGPMLAGPERERIAALRRPDQQVVLGVWRVLLEATPAQIDAAIDASLAGYRDGRTPYLALMGIDPGAGYAAWLSTRVPGAVTETWPEFGHYPHLVDPARTAARLRDLWATAAV